MKISVIIPVYGVEKYLRECLDSVLAQTIGDMQILLIDDGGKDFCPQIIDEYAQKDDRIVAIHKPNGGYGQTCNVGLDRAEGEYIAIVEPDDYIDKNMFEDLYNIAKTNDSDIVKSAYYDNLQSPTATSCKVVEFEGIPQGTFTSYDCPKLLLYHPSIWSAIYKREFLKENNIRFVEAKGAGWTDNPFQVQVMCLAKRINYTPKAYYYWRRLNERACDDLKDWTLPFVRSNEIHDWLEANEVDDVGILANLYFRELAYVQMVLDKGRNDDALPEIYKLGKRMDDRVIEAYKFSKPRYKKQLLKLCQTPEKFCRDYMFRVRKRAIKNRIKAWFAQALG